MVSDEFFTIAVSRRNILSSVGEGQSVQALLRHAWRGILATTGKEPKALASHPVGRPLQGAQLPPGEAALSATCRRAAPGQCCRAPDEGAPGCCPRPVRPQCAVTAESSRADGGSSSNSHARPQVLHGGEFDPSASDGSSRARYGARGAATEVAWPPCGVGGLVLRACERACAPVMACALPSAALAGGGDQARREWQP